MKEYVWTAVSILVIMTVIGLIHGQVWTTLIWTVVLLLPTQMWLVYVQRKRDAEYRRHIDKVERRWEELKKEKI